MKFLVDENLPPAVATLLARLGHDATHVIAVGMLGSTDERILRLALDQERVVVTRDSDFDAPTSPLRVLKINIGNCSNAELLRRLEPQLAGALSKLERGDPLAAID